jgi:hypothetical protein
LKTPLSIDIDDLCIAFEMEASPDAHWYLDAQTGVLLLVNAEYDPADIGEPTMDEIQADPARYLAIPPAQPAQAALDLQEFAQSRPDPVLRESLEIALSGIGPVRRFKKVLDHLPEQREGWYAFKRQRTEARARAWLAEHQLAVAAA